MIEIILNGKSKNMEEGKTLEQLILDLGFQPKWIVAELNGSALLKKDYPKIFLKQADQLELVRPVSGG